MRSASGSSTAAILRCRWRRRNVLFVFQLPYNQITKPDQERNQSERPRTVFPIVNRPEPNHQAQAHHGQYNPAPHIRAPAHTSHLGCKQFRGNRLTFLYHHADRPLPHAIPYKSKHPYREDDQYGRTEYREEYDRHDGDCNEIAHFFEVGIFILIAAIDDDSMLASKLFLQLPV